MKNLILIRHAKSSWEAPLKDIDRPLDNRGIHDAHLVAANCLHFLPSTYVIFSSIAKRASHTAYIFAQNFLYPIESIVYNEELYTFDVNQLEKIIKSCSNSLESIILFGHNEAITNFVNKFGDVFISNVPTAGFVSLQFDTDNWMKINKGKTQKIIFPKKLKLK
ncbi:SixA phosphatase family protein [Flavobacterium cellulosilyticum]|uniref:Histidine phosphatase family protein n=1 Tax=Flavobacterium cellulosilyticum TaxID=2541731 RepID=A0A4R5C9A8_9FLAO|nr:histidine phosphatase family protein [Flavobacterium cellulosilyticum]TDD93602.1 histidine phosphatase family protein [Flavobacterium cellulosilyticum]